MDFIISFFRDTLDGTTYVIVCSVSAVLLCACIGYLADKKSKKENPVQQENNEQTSPVPEQPANNPVAPESIENIGVVENPVPPQSENITMPVEQPQQAVTPEQVQTPESSPIAQPTGNIENEVLGQTPQVPQMPEQTQVPSPEQVPNAMQQEEPIFPPVDSSTASPVGITPPPVEATAPIQQAGEQIPQEQPVFSQATEQVPQTSPIIGENINTNVSQTDMINANPNLNISEEGIAGQVAEQPQQIPATQPLPSAASPSMEAANLDMPQMPVEGAQQPVQAETLDNIADATEQIEEEQIIDNPRPTAVAETPTEQPVPQEVIGGQVGEQIPQPQQAVAPQNIETGNNPQTIGQ